ncbi:MAG: SMC family ATPase [Chloroflexi bacterium]|nr:SMC family ATPase [Chloroflexota bacterium]
MIPVRLRVRNFMCYGEGLPTLDFSGLRVACLVGNNGHGKSALLDAMTWALWGKARSSRDDNLVRQGETEMEVELEFDLSGQRYRVLRRRTLGRRASQPDLELYVRAGDQNQILTESTIRATQERLLALLGLDYDTFTSSAFLLQGRADQFTTQPPAKRKEILAEILGLSRYDRYEQIAKERARAQGLRRVQLEGEIAEADRELAHEPLYRQQQAEAEARVTQLEASATEADTDRQRHGEHVRVLEERAKEAQALERRIQQVREGARALERRQAQRAERLTALQALMARGDEIRQGVQDLAAARERVQILAERAEQRRGLEAESHALQQRVLEARHGLQTQEKVLGDRLQKAQTQAAQHDQMVQQAEQLHTRLAEMEAEQARGQALQEEREALSSEKAGLTQQNERLRADMVELREQLDLLGEGADAGRCPLCRQPLAPEDRAKLAAQTTAEGQDKKAAYTANHQRLEEIDQALTANRKGLEGLTRRLTGLPALQRELAAAEQALAQATAAAQEAEGLAGQHAALRQAMAEGRYAETEQARLEELRSRLAEVAFDPEDLQAARQEVDRLAPYEGQAARLEAAAEQAAALEADLKADRQSLAERAEQLAAEEERLGQLNQAAAALRSAREDLRRSEAAWTEAQAALAQARSDLGGARQRVAHCEHLRAARREKVQERDAASEEQGLYEELQQAVGKRGVPAMLIDQSLPEITEEANRLLWRMTDGRMHVELNTQRDTKSGGTVETLDILIGDELGTRPYELYSGGEAFRVNFALRVALARLLARRAGARLQTLIVDEGFGTQDAQGRERLVEAINSVSDDFECILVVTHVEELKELFPVSIEVTKTDQGSVFAIR